MVLVVASFKNCVILVAFELSLIFFFFFGRARPSYHERLGLMGLLTLVERRKRGDLITTFQALVLPNSPIKHLFILSNNERTRGHRLKLAKDKFRTSMRQNFISNRVFDWWNSLPADIVRSDTTVSFKRTYDAYCEQC